MELASGTGLPSLAAHRCSARVTCTDVSLLAHRLVLTAAQMQPGGEISTRVFDILLDSPERLLEMKPDIVVASDSFYEEALAEALGRHLGTAARSGATVIATDPWRMEGRGQTIFLDSFWKAMAPAAQPSQASQASQAHFEKQCIPDRILDRGLNAMKYGGQVDRSVGVFEFYAQSENQGIKTCYSWLSGCASAARRVHLAQRDLLIPSFTSSLHATAKANGIVGWRRRVPPTKTLEA